MATLGMWILQGLRWLAGPIVISVLVALGFGVVSYTGINLALSELADVVIDQFDNEGEFGDILVQMALVLNLDRAFSLILSAAVVRFTLAGMSAGGTLARWRLMPGGG